MCAWAVAVTKEERLTGMIGDFRRSIILGRREFQIRSVSDLIGRTRDSTMKYRGVEMLSCPCFKSQIAFRGRWIVCSGLESCSDLVFFTTKTNDKTMNMNIKTNCCHSDIEPKNSKQKDI